MSGFPLQESEVVRKSGAGICLDDLATMAVFSVMVSSGVAAIYYFSRLEFEDSHFSELTKCLSLSWFLTCSGPVWRILAPNTGIKRRIPDAAIYLSALLLMTILGMLTTFVSFDIELLVRAVGVMSLTATMFVWIKGFSWVSCLLFVTLSAPFSLWVGLVAFGSGYQTPLFNEMLLVGEPPIDTLFHVSVANMMNTYGTPSTGLDGIPYLPYHFGSHWLFAQFSRILKMDLLQFYNLGFPIIFIPFFLNSMLVFTLTYKVVFITESSSDGGLRSNYFFWIALILAHLGIVPAKIYGGNSQLISESYALGLTAFFLFSSIALHLWKIISTLNPNDSKLADVALFWTVGVMLAVVGLFKLSLMILSFIVTAYLTIRIGRFSQKFSLLFAAMNALIFVLVINSTISSDTPGLALEPFHYIRNFVQQEWWPWFPIFELFWSWVFILLKTHELGLTKLGSLKDAIISNKIVDVECVVVVSLTGLLPGLLMAIPGGSAAYFSDFQKWLSICLIMANLDRFMGIMEKPELAGVNS